MKERIRSVGGWVLRYPVFALFVVSYTVTHLSFEYSFWFTDGETVFGKYAKLNEGNALVIARRVYFAKATWMFMLVWLLVLRLPLRAAVTYSFLVYSVELLLWFEPNLYLMPTLLLAVGLVIELWVKPVTVAPGGR